MQRGLGRSIWHRDRGSSTCNWWTQLGYQPPHDHFSARSCGVLTGRSTEIGNIIPIRGHIQTLTMTEAIQVRDLQTSTTDIWQCLDFPINSDIAPCAVPLRQSFTTTARWKEPRDGVEALGKLIANAHQGRPSSFLLVRNPPPLPWNCSGIYPGAWCGTAWDSACPSRNVWGRATQNNDQYI